MDEKYNYVNYLKNYIKRELYHKKIAPFIDKVIIKVLIGQRRTGKSYLLYQLMDNLHQTNPGSNIIYINKELSDFDFISNYEELNAFVKKQTKPGKNYLFIDEIQDINDFGKALRNLLASEKYDIYCTGSNSRLLSGDIAGHLSGRFLEIKVYGLSFSEFLHFHQLENDDLALQKYMQFGGLPYLVHLVLTQNVVTEYLTNVYHTVLFKDVVGRFNIRNVFFLERLVRFLADNTGSLVSATQISKYLKSQGIKMSTQTVLDYLGYLTAALLVLRIERATIQGKKVFETLSKYFFEDWGLRNAIVGYSPADRSKLMENMVLLHLLTCGYKVTVGIEGSREIDFVATKDNETIYVQVTYTLGDEKTVKHEFGNLLAIQDNYPKYVVSAETFTGNSYKGIKTIRLREFLSHCF